MPWLLQLMKHLVNGPLMTAKRMPENRQDDKKSKHPPQAAFFAASVNPLNEDTKKRIKKALLY